MKKFIWLLVKTSVLVILLSCGSTNIISEKNKEIDCLRLSPNVSPEMLNADFWISRAKNPYEVKMSREQIFAWNKEACQICYPGTKSHILTDLRKIDSYISSAQLRSQLFRYNQAKAWYKKSEGEENKIKELGRKDWKKLYDKMNYSQLESFSYFMYENKASDEAKYDRDFPVKKAVCVKRADLRLFPDGDFYSTDYEYWYDDMAQNSGALVNEALLVLFESSDGEWFFVQTSYCTGWIKASSIAFCSDSEFEEYFDYPSKDQSAFLTITEDSFILSPEDIIPCQDKDFQGPVELFMGSYLHCVSWDSEDFKTLFPEREPYANYLVELPYRKADGSLGKAHALINGGKCRLGLLDFTTAAVLDLAFKPLGRAYGWGGMAGNRDCSEYLKDIFRCFGFSFPRNSRAQIYMPGQKIDFTNKSDSSRKSALASLEEASPLGFPGHVLLYLGRVNGRDYVISALGAYYPEDYKEGDPKSEEKVIYANSVTVNGLDVYRNTGKNWLQTLVTGINLNNKYAWPGNEVKINEKWQFADFSKIKTGTSYLYKSSEKNRKNITVAVNAGHGAKGGHLVKTYSHPDKSPKLTGGTNAQGAVESMAISGGMTFNDGKSESEVNLRTARLFKDKLLSAGYDVLMIRDSMDTQLDNVARTVMANNNARIHIAIHYDGDGQKIDKGVFYCSIPEGLKKLSTVKKHWKESERLGQCLVKALSDREFSVYNEGKMEIDLTQTSYSTIPTVDIELGNQWTDTKTSELDKRAQALLEGVELFFKK
ncbi:MAG: SH3 domain-containing protein [Treponema sp.]|nr:SH3 domain-containing protein [Treponema sp.]